MTLASEWQSVKDAKIIFQIYVQLAEHFLGNEGKFTKHEQIEKKLIKP